MDNKSKKEKLFIIVSLFAVSFVVLCLTSCSGSCMGLSVGCESEEEIYNLGGCSYLSDGCGSNGLYLVSCGSLNTSNEESDLNDMYIINCGSYESDYYDGTSGCYTGCVIGRRADCGDCVGVYGSVDMESADETSISCVDGCFGCSDTDGMWAYIFENIYALIGIGG